MAFVSYKPCERGVASEGGVTSVPVITSKRRVASVSVYSGEGSVAYGFVHLE